MKCEDCKIEEYTRKCHAEHECEGRYVCDDCSENCHKCGIINCYKCLVICNGCDKFFCYETCRDYCGHCEQHQCEKCSASDNGIGPGYDEEGMRKCGTCIEGE